MNKNRKTRLIIMLAVISGYVSMGFLITVVQEWIFGGVSYNKSSLIVLAVAGFGTFLSAIMGGWLAYFINSYSTKLSNMIMCGMVIVETTWILNTFKADSPIWFDVLAALSLIIGILIPTQLNILRINIAKIKSKKSEG